MKNITLKIQEKDLPKVRDPHRDILTNKSGVSGVFKSYYFGYDREKNAIETKGLVAEETAHSETNKTERENEILEVIGQIEQWAGGAKNILAKEYFKGLSVAEKALAYANFLKQELKDDYYLSNDPKNVAERELIENWLSFLLDKEKESLHNIKEMVLEVDPVFKALTGRTPARIESETGIAKEKIFPPDKKILYVGDPWQRMGKEIDTENFTLIDYEFGETASFIFNQESFLLDIDKKAENMLYSIDEKLADADNDLLYKDLEWLEDFRILVIEAREKTKLAINSETDFVFYQKAAEAWSKVREYIETTYRQELEDVEQKEYGEETKGDPGDLVYSLQDLSFFRTQSWYDAVYGERGFRDIPDYQQKILPELEEYEENLREQNIASDKIQYLLSKKKKSLIDKIRLNKKTKKANVVQAIFPELPFRKESFDRFVASWSISAHIFAELNKEEFKLCWQEINRVLKQNGEAYIFPLNYGFIDEKYFLESLQEYASENGLIYKFHDAYGEEMTSFDCVDTYTLFIKKI